MLALRFRCGGLRPPSHPTDHRSVRRAVHTGGRGPGLLAFARHRRVGAVPQGPGLRDLSGLRPAGPARGGLRDHPPVGRASTSSATPRPAATAERPPGRWGPACTSCGRRSTPMSPTATDSAAADDCGSTWVGSTSTPSWPWSCSACGARRGWDAILLILAAQLLQMVRQLAPMVRFDGYHVLADLTGVPDLYSRMGAILLSLWPGRPADPRVAALKRGPRVVVTAWVLVDRAVAGLHAGDDGPGVAPGSGDGLGLAGPPVARPQRGLGRG